MGVTLKMVKKYIVSEKIITWLKKWYTECGFDRCKYVRCFDLGKLPKCVDLWIFLDNDDIERNIRTMAIIRWVNGEDVFEVEKPKKWVVRSKETDDEGDYWYVRLPNNIDGINDVVYYMSSATLFDTKEEAESWANAHQEVVEVE